MNLKNKNSHCPPPFPLFRKYSLIFLEPSSGSLFMLHLPVYSKQNQLNLKGASFCCCCYWLLLCWHTEVLSQNQEADPHYLRNPSTKQQQILLYSPLHQWQEGIQGENSTSFTHQSPCQWGRVGQWLQVNSKKFKGFKVMFPKPAPPCHCADPQPLHQRRT